MDLNNCYLYLLITFTICTISISFVHKISLIIFYSFMYKISLVIYDSFMYKVSLVIVYL